jgi:hypothetical protein
MGFDYLQFGLYVLGVLAIPGCYWLLTKREERRSEREAKREGEELMGGPYIGYP